jgi:hypothetical protein
MTMFLNGLYAQKFGVIRGSVRDKNTQEGIPGANLIVEGTEVVAVTDLEGNFRVEKIPVGSYNLTVRYLGYKPQTKFNILVTTGNVNFLTFELEEDVANLGEVIIKEGRESSPAVGDIVTPLSVQSLTTEEIRTNPGGNFDISRVVQVLPGVAGTTGGGGFRNDIIIRGGAPNENVYYLDGIEIPVINHFSTQGSAGGPVGLLNVSFIEDVKLSSSAFDARYDNALASVFQFKQREGNDKFQGNVRLSSTELATTFEGPAGKKTTWLASVRRSYLQLLFQAIDLPIRPNYWDFQFKISRKINSKTSLTMLGVGAIDEFSFGVPRNATAESEFILRSLPSINQWNYTTGVSVKRLIKGGFYNIALSRNTFSNSLDRFEDRDIGNEAKRLLRSRSTETENKLRLDFNQFFGGWKISYGAVIQYVEFKNDFFSRLRSEIRDSLGNLIQPRVDINFNTALGFVRYGAFAQISKTFFDRLGLSFGLRTDMNNFMTKGNQPLETISPRFSASYALTPKLNLNASVGTYFKLPIYTVLGFKDQNGEFVNQNSRYIQSTHFVGGFEYLPKKSLRITLEGYVKDYSRYPVSARDGISLANQGGEFGAVGNEAVISTGNGRVYGFELYAQQKLTRKTFGVISYTFVISEFSGRDGRLLASAWDNRHLISGILGRKLGRNWELGVKYRFAGGSPYTPLDLVESQRNYASLGNGLLDFGRVNSLRLNNFNQLDLRIDKKWNFKNWTLDLFLDIQNITASTADTPPSFTFARTADNSNWLTTDSQPLRPDGSNAKPILLGPDPGRPLPSIGFIVEF